MSSQIDPALLVLSALLLGVLSGAYAALELISYRYAEKNGEDDGAKTKFIDHLLGNPIHSYLSIGLGRVLVLALLVVVSYRVAVTRGLLAPGLLAFMILVLFLPLVGAKLVALRNPDGFVEHTKYVTYPVIYLLRPVVYAVVASLRRLSPGLLDALSFPVMPFKRRIELYGYKNGDEETDEQQLVSSVFDFGLTKVREVMVPRIDMAAVDIHTTSDALDTIIDAGHSRIPVYDESIDRIVGVVHTKDVLEKVVGGGGFSLGDIMREVYFVPESKMIDGLLSEFKKRRVHIAIAVDEYGGTAGLITLEDVLEELVGDIHDEFDEEEELIKVQNDDTVLCSARVRLEELNEALGLGLPEGGADTLGGFLYESIGRVPRVGEVFKNRGLEFRIDSIVRQRIDKVQIKGLGSFRQKLENGNG